MTEARPKHISETITDSDDDWNVGRGMPNWSRSYENGKACDYLFGTEETTIARLFIMHGGPPHLIEINDKYPSLGYDGLDAFDVEEGIRLVHEWWYVCFQIMASNFDINQHPDIDLEECIGCYSRTLDLAKRVEEKLKKAGKIIQKAIDND